MIIRKLNRKNGLILELLPEEMDLFLKHEGKLSVEESWKKLLDEKECKKLVDEIEETFYDQNLPFKINILDDAYLEE